MTKTLKILGIIILLCSCKLLPYVGCSLPLWITQLDTQTTVSTWVTVGLDEAHIWSSGDSRGELAIQIARTLNFYFDGQLLESYKVLHRSPFQLPVYVYDTDGTIIGSYGEFRTVSFMSPNQPGSHTITIEVTRTTGEVLTYNWVLIIDDE